ncbi:ATP-grasp domain-containing protein [Myxosarcina sp. GI1]|uniref:ATP-grasp domain-containing protein n=1 Tax=Myxosarcina sp. GI1 TaxID=1541065 RepID=UPI00056C1546|nr:ATP-grasp domain-containing protein [Myxosarcina sp. GI1]
MSRKKIFNHDIMHCTHDAVSGNYLYSGRVLGMTEPEDIIQLHPELKSQWQAITSHYDNIGLSHSQNPIWDVSFQKFKDYPDRETSVFIFCDEMLDSDRETSDGYLEWKMVVEFINSKNNFIRLAEELNVPVPLTICASTKAQLLSNDKIPYPCYLKPAVSVDGVGIYRCEDRQELDEALTNLADDIPLQLQQEVVTPRFLNLQYQITKAGVEPLVATEQILDGFAHQGNRYPTAYQPWDIVEPMANWMAEKGMREIFAFDVAVIDKEDKTQYYAIECNPRFNGASYPTGIARKLNIDSWSSETFTSNHKSLEDLNLKGLEYDPAQKTGVILVNWGSILVGKIAVLLAGSLDEQDKLRQGLKERLE